MMCKHRGFHNYQLKQEHCRRLLRLQPGRRQIKITLQRYSSSLTTTRRICSVCFWLFESTGMEPRCVRQWDNGNCQVNEVISQDDTLGLWWVAKWLSHWWWPEWAEESDHNNEGSTTYPHVLWQGLAIECEEIGCTGHTIQKLSMCKNEKWTYKPR